VIVAVIVIGVIWMIVSPKKPHPNSDSFSKMLGNWLKKGDWG